jgi:hypothetical protein
MARAGALNSPPELKVVRAIPGSARRTGLEPCDAPILGGLRHRRVGSSAATAAARIPPSHAASRDQARPETTADQCS